MVDDGLDLVTAHGIADEAHHRLLHDVPRLVDVTVHVSPKPGPGGDHHDLLAHHRRPG